MVIGLSRMACGRSEWKGMILSTFGGDEDSGLAGPKGFTAERGGSNGTAATLPAARSMSFMRSQKQTAACRFKRMAGLATQMFDQSNPSSFNERCTAGRAFIRSK
jgi:hypothetical protein